MNRGPSGPRPRKNTVALTGDGVLLTALHRIQPAPYFMDDFSDHLIFVDESGDHDLTKVNADYPVFVLVFCLVKKADYIGKICPALQTIKHRYWGHDEQVLHEHEIRKPNKNYDFLFNPEKRAAFMADITTFVSEAPFTLVAVVIRKDKLVGYYKDPAHPYELALQLGIERIRHELHARGDDVRRTTIIVESRGKTEDAELELAFLRIRDGGCGTGKPLSLEMLMVTKASNSAGLQLADLVARPVGIKAFRTDQEHRAYAVVEKKFRKSPNGTVTGYGLKIFP